MSFLDILTFASYIALTADIVLQIHCVQKHKVVDDVSIAGLSIRYLAILIILYKFFTLGEWPLLYGQLLLALTFSLYLVLVATHYRKTSD